MIIFDTQPTNENFCKFSFHLAKQNTAFYRYPNQNKRTTDKKLSTYFASYDTKENKLHEKQKTNSITHQRHTLKNRTRTKITLQ